MVKTSFGLAATADGQADPQQPAAVRAVAFGVVVLVMVGYWAIARIAPGELIRPIDPNLFAVAVFLGVFSGLLLAARMIARRNRGSAPAQGRIGAIVGAMILPLLLASACMRLGVQVAAFAGLPRPPTTLLEFTVTGTRVGRGSSHYLRVRHDAAGREFSVPVGTGLYEAAQPGDVLPIPVETGRFGIQRAMVRTGFAMTDLRHPR